MRSRLNLLKMLVVGILFLIGTVDCSQSGGKKGGGGNPTSGDAKPEVVEAKTPAPSPPPPAACLTEPASTPDAPSSSNCQTGNPQTPPSSESTPPSPSPSAPTPPPAVADGGPGYEACDKLGQAWIPSTSADTRGQCGPKLVSWCCNESEVYSRFGTTAADLLKPKFKANFDQGLLLYHCAVEGTKYTFYFFKGDAQGVRTGQVWLSYANVKNDPSATPCKKLTAAELGADKI